MKPILITAGVVGGVAVSLTVAGLIYVGLALQSELIGHPH